MIHNFFASCPRQLEQLLAAELRELGAHNIVEHPAGVAFKGSLGVAYKALIHSRLANNIVQEIGEFFHGNDWQRYYHEIAALPWPQYFSVDKTIAIDAAVIDSPLNHSRFAVQKAKDAIVDVFRERSGTRPSIQIHRPDVALTIIIKGERASVNFNLSGESLHRRGYRLSQGEAPLKENLAAAVLLRAKWPEFAAEGAPLVDLMCGSGTLLIEAALMAGKIAPGLLRTYFAAKGLNSFDTTLWQTTWEHAQKIRSENQERIPKIRGYDADATVIAQARENIARAGLSAIISVETRELSLCTPAEETRGMIVINPPYGERLGELKALEHTYAQLGSTVKACFSGWQLSVLTSNPQLARHMKLSPKKINKFFNGSIPCELWNCMIGTYQGKKLSS
jgi:23S rRNA (guanine2445-N2)-methyltransferase / 23S rRNA (guanine2069-N7)-methyltransferase